MYKCSLFVFLASLTLVYCETQECPDRWALQNVTAYWKGAVMNTSGFYNESTNFYLLENFTMIHVVKANVSVLCEGMVKDFRRLKYLALTKANISKILPNSFSQLPNLVSLSLAVNHITSLSKDQFENLKNVKILYLSANLIEDIASDTFHGLVNLEKIYLDKNRIAEIDSKWFLGNTKISYINLAFNSISKLQQGAFNIPKKSIVNILLQHNNIEEIEKDALISGGSDEEKPNVALHVEHNELREIPNDFVASMDNFHSTLYFNFNDITYISPEFLSTVNHSEVEIHFTSNPLDCLNMYDVTKFEIANDMKNKLFYNSTKDCRLYDLKVPPEWNQNRY